MPTPVHVGHLNAAFLAPAKNWRKPPRPVPTATTCSQSLESNVAVGNGIQHRQTSGWGRRPTDELNVTPLLQTAAAEDQGDDLLGKPDRSRDNAPYGLDGTAAVLRHSFLLVDVVRIRYVGILLAFASAC
jgi:hypothetical protein